MDTTLRDRDIATTIIKRAYEETKTICEDLADKYNMSWQRVYAIAKEEGAIDKKNDINGNFKPDKKIMQESKNMIPFDENFNIEVGRMYNITVKNPQGTDIRHERVKCTYRRKDNWYFCFENITVNRGNIITGEIKVKGV